MIQNLPAWFMVMLGVVAAIGAVTATIRSSGKAANVAALRADNTDLRERLDDRDATIADLTTKMQAMQSDMDRLRISFTTLQGTVDAAAKVEVMSQKIDGLSSLVTTEMSAIRTELKHARN